MKRTSRHFAVALPAEALSELLGPVATRPVGQHESAVIGRRGGPLEVGADLLIIVFTAAPGSEAAGRLRLLSVLGSENMSL